MLDLLLVVKQEGHAPISRKNRLRFGPSHAGIIRIGFKGYFSALRA
jgi:hypothetical protein